MIELLFFGLVILSIICLWLLIEGRKSPKFLIWFIPLLLMLVSSTYMTYTSLLGYPKFENPNKDYILNIISMNRIGFTYGLLMKKRFQYLIRLYIQDKYIMQWKVLREKLKKENL